MSAVTSLYVASILFRQPLHSSRLPNIYTKPAFGKDSKGLAIEKNVISFSDDFASSSLNLKIDGNVDARGSGFGNGSTNLAIKGNVNAKGKDFGLSSKNLKIAGDVKARGSHFGRYSENLEIDGSLDASCFNFGHHSTNLKVEGDVKVRGKQFGWDSKNLRLNGEVKSSGDYFLTESDDAKIIATSGRIGGKKAFDVATNVLCYADATIADLCVPEGASIIAARKIKNYHGEGAQVYAQKRGFVAWVKDTYRKITGREPVIKKLSEDYFNQKVDFQTLELSLQGAKNYVK